MSISIMTNEVKPEPQEKQEPCSGCKQLQTEVAKTIGLVMERVDKLQYRIDELMKEAELKKALESSGSSGKVTPSPTVSRNSPKLDQVATPTVSISAPITTAATLPATLPATTNGARKRKTKERTPTVTTAASPLPDFTQFVNGFMFDPISCINNQANMMQLLSFVQQQQGQPPIHQAIPQQHAQSLSPPEPKMVKTEEPVIAVAPVVKEEAPETTLEVAADAEMASDSMASQTQNLLDVLTAQFSTNQAASLPSSVASSAVQQVVEAVATPSRSESDDNNDPNTARCSNCRTDKTTAWRRDADGKLVCNPCGLYYRLHKVCRPIEMRKNHIQQRYRRKNKEKDTSALTDPAIFNQLLTQIPSMSTGGAQTTPLSFLEQITQFTQAQELMNSSATF